MLARFARSVPRAARAAAQLRKNARGMCTTEEDGVTVDAVARMFSCKYK